VRAGVGGGKHLGDGLRRRATNKVVATIKVANRPLVIKRGFGDLWLTHLQDDELWRLRVPPLR